MLKIIIIAAILYPFCISGQTIIEPLYDDGFHNTNDYFLGKPGADDVRIPVSDSSKSYFSRKLFHEHFIYLDKPDFKLAINPLLNLYAGGSDKKNNTIYRNTRAVNVKGAIGEKVVFQSSFYETQLNAPVWFDKYRSNYGVLPGETNPKGFGDDGYDIGSVYGSFFVKQSLQNMKMQFRFGYDNHFIGDGYRSLFLSDFSLPFLFGSLQLKYKEIEYLHLTASLQNPNFGNVLNIETTQRPSTAPYQKKTMSLHYLRWNISSKVSLGFFEGTVFRVADTAERKFSLNYINPVPAVNLAMYGLDRLNNVMIGSDLSVDWSPYLSTYFQWLQDTKNPEGIALLASARFRHPNWKFFLEYTHTGNEVFSHRDGRQSYTHYNQPLSHPSGAGSDEWITGAGYRFNNFEAETEVILQRKHQDFDFSISSDSGAKSTHRFYEGTLRYIFNPLTRLQVFATYIMYHGSDNTEQFFHAGIKTQLRREYMKVTP